MGTTNSLAFPNMFDVSRNVTQVVSDGKSVVNRTRLLILTEPTELYNNPTFGVGLKRHLWQYNNENEKTIIRDRIIEQLRLNEPCVVPESTTLANGLLFTGSGSVDVTQQYDQMKITIMLETTFGDNVEVTLNGNNE